MLKQVEALQTAAKEGKDAAVQKQVQRAAAESDFYSHQLAQLHGERDRALVEMTRLEEVAPLARKEHGVNKRIVSSATCAHSPFSQNLLHVLTSLPLKICYMCLLPFLSKSKS